MGNIKLINPRGRVITVESNEVTQLLRRGFVFLPIDQPDIKYSQVHDKGEEFQPQHEIDVKQEFVVQKTGDTLQIEQV